MLYILKLHENDEIYDMKVSNFIENIKDYVEEMYEEQVLSYTELNDNTTLILLDGVEIGVIGVIEQI